MRSFSPSSAHSDGYNLFKHIKIGYTHQLCLKQERRRRTGGFFSVIPINAQWFNYCMFSFVYVLNEIKCRRWTPMCRVCLYLKIWIPM